MVRTTREMRFRENIPGLRLNFKTLVAVCSAADGMVLVQLSTSFVTTVARGRMMLKVVPLPSFESTKN
mgnify:CR=1 FL=1